MFSKVNFYRDMIRLLQDDRIRMKRKKAYLAYLERQLYHLLCKEQSERVKFQYDVILDLR